MYSNITGLCLRALSQTGLSTSVSSHFGDEATFGGHLAIDGNTYTNWHSENNPETSNDWLQVDMGSDRWVERVEVIAAAIGNVLYTDVEVI